MDGIYTKALEHNEIKEMINSFADAAVRCEKSGFDGVELHGAHSYLICQFLGKITNRRDDEWGGDLEGRSKFLREIIKLIRERTNPNFLIAVRISPIIEKAGIFLEDSLELAKILSKLEIDMLHISCWDVFQKIESDSQNRSLTKLFRGVIPDSLPLISTGAVWTAKDAKYVFDEGADLVGVARVGIAHPDWPKYISDISYSPQRPPFSVSHLLEMDLSPVFIDYMMAWKGFVIGGK
jgi:2,4-dienoyl-CoA reductase-like NADH-dependent reductase (Old Yellow Enzyme family)